MRAERVLLLPPPAELQGTPYAQAHRLAAAAVQAAGGTVVGEEPGTGPAEHGGATALMLLRPIPADRLRRSLEANPQVDWVQFPFAGIEPFIPLARSRPDVTWTSAKGLYAPPVAEHALALTLALLRHLPERARATGWGEGGGRSLHGSRVVVLGGGGIAREYIRLLRAWDVHVTAVRRRDEPVPGADRTVTAERLDEVLPTADVVMLAAAATESTAGIIGARQLASMSQNAVLVNVGRGVLVDTAAVTAALGSGSVQGYATDVTDPEPLPESHPLWDEPRCLITPHTADTPQMCIPLLQGRIERNLAARTIGRPLEGLVDLEGGY